MNAMLQPQPQSQPSPRWQRRPLLAQDLDAVQRIEDSAYPFPWTRSNFIDSLAAGHVAEALEGGAELLGYFVALVGVDELHLRNLTIAPPWQGQGLGRALLDAVSSQGRERGLQRLLLEVRESNSRAQALYLRQGFEVIGRRKTYYPAAQGREDAVVMSLALDAGGVAHELD